MESDWVNGFIVCVVVLKQSIRADIENFNLFISAARGQTWTIRMELNIIYHARVIMESVNSSALNDIPQLDGPIVWAWGDHSWVKWKLCATNPVLMALESVFFIICISNWITFEALNEPTFFYIPNFDIFIVSSWHKQWSVRVKGDTLDWCWVTLHDSACGRGIIRPNSDSLISRARSNQSSSIVDGDICDWPFVSLEFIRSGIGSQAPR